MVLATTCHSERVNKCEIRCSPVCSFKPVDGCQVVNGVLGHIETALVKGSGEPDLLLASHPH